MKRLLLYSLVVAGLSFASLTALAQPAGGGPPGGPSGGSNPPCWPPPCIPVDGGISIIIAIGAAYGSKKAYDHFKSKSELDA